jgi:predicted anti-sigma-YlaC factor YlaD
VESAYWCGVSLAAEVSLSKDRPEVVAQLPGVGAIMAKVLALNESFGTGSVHSFMVNYEARGESMGGSMERARKHFDRAVELTGGNKAGVYVTWAEAYCVPRQDMACFNEMLDKALAVDVNRVPGFRLENTLSQRRATWLRGRATDLIDVPTTEE